jgi:hypothetical protein
MSDCRIERGPVKVKIYWNRRTVGIIPADEVELRVRPLHRDRNAGDQMSVPPIDYFDAGFPGATQIVRITNFHEAKVFARRWVIRDKNPALKALLRHLEQANSSATADSAVRQLKQALASRGMLVTATPSHGATPAPNNLPPAQPSVR